MTVRFETRASGPGQAHTLPHDSPDVTRAKPVDSLDWPDYVDRLTASDEGAP
jgi:DNA polymerase-4